MNATETATTPSLAVRDLSVAFPRGDDVFLAANGVSFTVRSGSMLGLVGESGCGKSVTVRALMRLVPAPGEIVEGSIAIGGRDVREMTTSELQDFRGRTVSMVFQDPASSLSPVHSIGDQLSEVLRKKLGMSKRAAHDRALELMDRVGLPSPKLRYRDYPHQLSGGMRQRVMIALAIACEPQLLLADEPTTALDVTVQEQVLALLRDLQVELGMSVVMVTHDLGVVAQSCDDVVVMYAGDVVESGPTRVVLDAPAHPYTRGLLDAAPSADLALRGEPLSPIPGQPPDLAALGGGCPFRDRCPYSRPECAEVSMALVEVSPGHLTACPYPVP